MSIIIRIAGEQDIPSLIIVHKQTWLATYPNEHLDINEADILEKNFESDERVAFWKKILNDLEVRIWVAEAHSKVVGFCEAKKDEPNNILEAIYILPEFQRQGIGGQFFSATCDWLGDEKPIEVQVASYNVGAINFYKKFGFIEQDIKIRPYLLPNGKQIPLISMLRA